MNNKRALIIVDPQQDFLQEVEDKQKVENSIIQLVNSGRFSYRIATKFINQPNSSFVKQLGYHKMMEGDKETALIDQVEDLVDEIAVKHGYGISSTEIARIKKTLCDKGISDIEIAGLDSDACVLAVAYQMFDEGFSVYINKEASYSSGGKSLYDASMLIARRNLGLI